MIKLVIKLLVSALAIWLTSQFFDNVTCEPWHVSIVVALVLGLINVFIKPIVKILSLPINILSLGLFSLVINGAMILLCSHFVDAFNIQGSNMSALGTAIASAWCSRSSTGSSPNSSTNPHPQKISPRRAVTKNDNAIT